VWVPNTADGTISEIDAAHSRLVATIRVGDPKQLVNGGCGAPDVHSFPVGSFDVLRCDLPSALLYFQGSLWAARNEAGSDSGSTTPQADILRIDPDTRRVIALVPVAAEVFGLAGGESGVWAMDYQNDSVARIDPATNRVVQVYRSVGLGPTHAIVTQSGVWITLSRQQLVVELDPATGRRIASIEVGKQPLAMALDGDGRLWVRNEKSSSLSVIDTRAGVLTATVQIDFFLGRDGQDGMATLGSRVWTSGIYLDAVDVATRRVVDRYNHPSITLVGAGHSIWTVDLVGTVTRIDVP
jgi:DNA-binding beta-propeller fold protein YncE